MKNLAFSVFCVKDCIICRGNLTYSFLNQIYFISIYGLIVLARDSNQKLLELINELSKVEGNKINIQKLVTFLYTNNEQSEKEIKDTMPITIASKRIKYLRIHLTKEVENLYN